MRIQHNIPSMNAYRNYNNNSGRLSNNLEKLSSGYRINRAGDDAAGLAISEKMRAQITGLEVAQKNAKDGISLVQTAEGALTEVQDMLNRMYSLAEQSANGTYDNSVDRAQLQKEVVSLREEIDRISDSANFNGIALLDGSLSAGGATSGTTSSGGSSGVTVGPDLTDYISTTAVSLGSDLATAANGTAGDLDAINALLKSTGLSFTAQVNNGGDDVTWSLSGNTLGTYEVSLTGNTLTFGDAQGQNFATMSVTLPAKAAKQNNTANSISDTVTVKTGSSSSSQGLAKGVMTLQIGDTPEDYDKLMVSIDSVNTKNLGVYTTQETVINDVTISYKEFDTTATGATLSNGKEATIANIDISDQQGAAEALSVIKNAINYVSDTRGGLGAIQNRLDHTINNLSVMQENMQDAESTIRDTDVADEMMKYTKNNILVQSAQAMLAQANQIPQGVLQLLQ